MSTQVSPADLPWADRSSSTWFPQVDGLRRANADRLTSSTKPSLVPPFNRTLLVTGRIGIALANWYAKGRGKSSSRSYLSSSLRSAFEDLGPTFVKLGQVISSGEGVFPPEVVSEMKHLRDSVPADRFAAIRRVVESEIGSSISEAFSSFDSKPMASASIAQVHRATLAGSGVPVVVKVQRSSVAKLIDLDRSVLSWLAPHLAGRIPVAALANPAALVELFASTVTEELDFRIEAANMMELADAFSSLGMSAVRVPRPHNELVTKRVLVMEQMHGIAWGDIEAVRNSGVDTENLMRVVLLAFVEPALICGVFHGDLHGGNILVGPGETVSLLDFGITGRFDQRGRIAFLKLLMSASADDITGQIEALKDLGALPAEADTQQVISDLKLDRTSFEVDKLSAEELASELRDISSGLLKLGARLPKELMLFLKDLFFIDGAVATLAPDIDLFTEIASTVMYFHLQHGPQIARETGIGAEEEPVVDLTGLRTSLGLAQDTESITHREIQSRREQVHTKMRDVRRRGH